MKVKFDLQNHKHQFVNRKCENDFTSQVELL